MMTSKKIEDDLKKKEDDLKKIKWKTTSKKMEDKPINQNKPNWL